MSLITATPPVGSRVRSSMDGSAARRPGAPRLRVVRDEHRAAEVALLRRALRPESVYRSQLSSRSTSGYPLVSAVGRARPVPARTRPQRPAAARSPRATSARARSQRPAAPVRLTRRGRLVVRAGSAGLVLLALTAGVLLLDRPAQAGSTPQSVPVSYRVVLPGETLWQIAGEVAPKADRRDTVARILDLNALSTAGVAAGQRIAVPVQTR